MSTIEEMFPITVSQDRHATLVAAAANAPTSALGSAALDIEFDDDEDSSRKDRVRARTISIKRLSKRELERGRQAFPESEYQSPVFRAQCLQGDNADRPCAFVSCKYHLYLDVSERTGAKSDTQRSLR